MRGIALLVPHMQDDDAVGIDVAGMQDALTRRGYDCRIFANDNSSMRTVFPADELPSFARTIEDIVLYHFAMDWSEALRILRAAGGTIVLKYHNITPARFFAPYNDSYAENSRAALASLPAFLDLNPVAIAGASSYNLRDILELGYDRDRTCVLRTFHRNQNLFRCYPDVEIQELLAGDRKTILMVGRIVPNKGYEKLIRAFAVYHYEKNPRSQLVLCGGLDPALKSYTDFLESLIARHGLRSHVVFTGRVTEAELYACYRSADLFAIASEHEGLCVPLIECMQMGIPIVALDRAAVGETLGDGMTLDSDDPCQLAAAWDRVLSDEGLRKSLVERGRAAYNDRFRNDRIEAQFLDFIAGIEDKLA